ncbi:MAG: LacI family transcriptional regulator [Kiritimatiellae bacterium]|nr:LacI family transcriptional regulator [Kiritimatiellia bacterium]MDW8458027.1 LacI family DNA-binding transcriptional regulator [Verrucomicrobiota bacterium]
MKAPLTQRDLARQAGVSQATVCLALRGDPRISKPVRDKIQSIAAAAGYRQNPLLSAYQAVVRSRKPLTYRATIGWLVDHPERDLWRNQSWLSPYFSAAENRAKDLGYALDEIWFPGIAKGPTRENIETLLKILRTRSIHALILPFLHNYRFALHKWAEISIVVIGRPMGFIQNRSERYTTNLNEYHEVNADAYYNLNLALENLYRRNYRRIGLLMSDWLIASTDHIYEAAYLGFLDRHPDLPRLSRCPGHEPGSAVLSPTMIRDWIQREQPDAIVCSHGKTRDVLASIGVRVPEDVGLCHLHLSADVAGWSGIDHNPQAIASAAVDLLTANIQRNEFGMPESPKEVLIKGRWVSGATTRDELKLEEGTRA